jgi:ABC-type branched-subunit amino acid transport system substrate-binding protein
LRQLAREALVLQVDRARRLVGIAVVGLLVTSGCGSRLDLSSAQRRAAADAAIGRGTQTLSQGATTGGLVNGTSTGTGGGPANGASTGTTGVLSRSTSGSVSGTTSSTGTGGSASGGTSGPVDNGGATDVGVTATTITVGNVSDLSGPQPGLFQGAVNGTEAYFAYLNSNGGINGRQVQLRASDGQTDCTANQNAHSALLNSVFAFVGSFSLYDDCGTQVIKAHPDIPDVSFALGEKTQQNTVNQFSPQFLPAGAPSGPFCYLAKKYPDLVKSVGSIYANIPSAAASQKAIEHAGAACGWKWIDCIPAGATDTTFNAQVTRMRNDGVKIVFEVATTVGSMAEMKREADAQGWKPLWVAPVAYSASFAKLMGSASAANGVIGYNLYSLFLGADEASRIPEVALFQQWMKRVHPEAPNDLFAMYGWGAAKLFAEQARAAGPKLTRAGFLAAIRKVHAWNAGGLLAESDIAGHKPGHCYVLWTIAAGTYRRLDSDGYRCDGQFVAPA